MAVYLNQTKRLLSEGKLALGMLVRQARTVEIGMLAKTCGYDWLFIDMEHASYDIDIVSQMSIAAIPVGVTPIVRVPSKEHHHSSRVLDNGAQGVVIPHVDTPEEARRIVSFCKYPPVGHRSVASMQPQFGFDPPAGDEFIRSGNAETLVIVMLESPQAIENADAIAAVPGIDVLLAGTNDLCAEMGVPGMAGDPKIEAAFRHIIDVCRKHSKCPGMAGLYDLALMEKYVAMGMRFVLSGSDLSFMMTAGRERSRFLRSIKR